MEIQELIDKLDSITDEVIEGVGKAIKLGGMLVERDSKINCPVDTGFLRNSIHTKYEGIGTINPSYDVEVGAEYGIHVEYGTSKMAAQPFLTPAFEKNKATIENMIKQAIVRGLNK